MYHSFDVEIAKEYGIAAAIILNHLDFWIEKNIANDSNYFDGEYWTYNSIKAMKTLYPYMSEKKIRSALNRLKDEDLIKTGNYSKSAYDRTLWYALTEKGKSILQNGKMEIPKKVNGNTEKVKCIYTDIRTDNNNTDIITDNNIKPVRHRYGEYKNVLLSDKEIDKLKAEIPNYQRYIENLSSYMMSTGKTYKSHLATIRNWARKDGVKPPKAETDEERMRREQNEQLLRAMGEI